MKQERGYIYHLQYHMAWTCYQQLRLLEGFEKEAKDILIKKCKDNDVEVVSADIRPDSVYLIVNCKPKHVIPDLLKALKGTSARHLMAKGLNCENAKGVWDGTNILSNDAEVQEELERYIQEQRSRRKKRRKSDYEE